MRAEINALRQPAQFLLQLADRRVPSRTGLAAVGVEPKVDEELLVVDLSQRDHHERRVRRTDDDLLVVGDAEYRRPEHVVEGLFRLGRHIRLIRHLYRFYVGKGYGGQHCEQLSGQRGDLNTQSVRDHVGLRFRRRVVDLVSERRPVGGGGRCEQVCVRGAEYGAVVRGKGVRLGERVHPSRKVPHVALRESHPGEEADQVAPPRAADKAHAPLRPPLRAGAERWDHRERGGCALALRVG
mmetsp:Transcript_14579/g.36871  ORF Transcript_14579/g.36871 Transcript_14579/m.36871 type:complete len:240 (+) Transcript_14579:141-860(+)